MRQRSAAHRPSGERCLRHVIRRGIARGPTAAARGSPGNQECAADEDRTPGHSVSSSGAGRQTPGHPVELTPPRCARKLRVLIAMIEAGRQTPGHSVSGSGAGRQTPGHPAMMIGAGRQTPGHPVTVWLSLRSSWSSDCGCGAMLPEAGGSGAAPWMSAWSDSCDGGAEEQLQEQLQEQLLEPAAAGRRLSS